jgi:hypothetical protein
MRILFNSATLVSLLLSIATVTLWLRSYFASDLIDWRIWFGEESLGPIRSDRGFLIVFSYPVTNEREFPHALALLPFLALPFWWALRHPRRLRPPAEFRCDNCGYDLRATPNRCPECGSLPPAAVGE